MWIGVDIVPTLTMIVINTNGTIKSDLCDKKYDSFSKIGGRGYWSGSSLWTHDASGWLSN